MLHSSPSFPPTPVTPSAVHILEIEHTENALRSWLQKRGREIVGVFLYFHDGISQHNSSFQTPFSSRFPCYFHGLTPLTS